MKVGYAVEEGEYESRHTVAIYLSEEDAQNEVARLQDTPHIFAVVHGDWPSQSYGPFFTDVQALDVYRADHPGCHTVHYAGPSDTAEYYEIDIWEPGDSPPPPIWEQPFPVEAG